MDISLKEQIEKLQNPAPLLDPEEEYWNDSSSAKLCRQGHSQDQEATGKLWKGNTTALKPKVSTRVAYLDQIDKKYQGNTVSRSQMAQQADQDDDSDDDSVDGSSLESLDDQSDSNQSSNQDGMKCTVIICSYL